MSSSAVLLNTAIRPWRSVVTSPLRMLLTMCSFSPWRRLSE